MKEPYGEGLATHTDPESCVDGRKAGGEALTGARTGQPLSCEIKSSGTPTLLCEAEGNTEDGDMREPSEGPAQSFGLSLHPEKTRLIEFGRFAADNRRKRGQSKPETFDFLGFTHMCGKIRIRKWFIVRRKTIKKRLRAALKRAKTILRSRMHDPVHEVGEWLQRVVLGYYKYHAVPGNHEAMRAFREDITRYWYKVLRRRGQKRRINWTVFGPIVRRWIPTHRVMHPHPNERFYAKHPR